MLIEIFTNGKIMLDGKDVGKKHKAESVLYEYLKDPAGFKLNG